MRCGYRGMVDNRDAEGWGGRGRSWHLAITQTGAQEREAGEQDDLGVKMYGVVWSLRYGMDIMQGILLQWPMS